MIRLEMRSSKMVSMSVKSFRLLRGNYFEIYIQKVLVLASGNVIRKS